MIAVFYIVLSFCSLAQFSLLSLFNICFDLMAESGSHLQCCAVIFQSGRGIMESLLSAYERLLCLISQAIFSLTFCKCYVLKAPFVIPVSQLSSSAELWRYCPVCVNFMQGKHRDWAIYVRKLV